ncbi:unnamed protein product [Anisakis simplex]|uniref:DM14 domain-containing protein n=1 Tax=Anisakis simplex TaxID=6269 RepID=A0A0M3KCG5_ANISI|nr:unnamed protein product [Anisakis simplex]
MDFASIEAATYGDVENDEELMAELLALEADEKAKANKARAHAASKAPKTPKTVTNSKQFTAPAASEAERIRSSVYWQREIVKGFADVAMKHAPSKGAGQLTPELLSQALKDIPDDELLADDDEEIDDAELLDELSNLVASEKKDGKTSSPTKKHVKEQQQPVGAVDTAMLKRLQQLNTDYSAVLKTANAEGSSVKARRQAEYQRAINKIQELLKKVEAGKPIDEAEIPVAIPASAPPVQPKPTTLPPLVAPRKPSPPVSIVVTFMVIFHFLVLPF